MLNILLKLCCKSFWCCLLSSFSIKYTVCQLVVKYKTHNKDINIWKQKCFCWLPLSGWNEIWTTRSMEHYIKRKSVYYRKIVLFVTAERQRCFTWNLSYKQCHLDSFFVREKRAIRLLISATHLLVIFHFIHNIYLAS